LRAVGYFNPPQSHGGPSGTTVGGSGSEEDTAGLTAHVIVEIEGLQEAALGDVGGVEVVGEEGAVRAVQARAVRVHLGAGEGFELTPSSAG